MMCRSLLSRRPVYPASLSISAAVSASEPLFGTAIRSMAAGLSGSRTGGDARSEMSVDVFEAQPLREHQHLQVVQQLRDLLGCGIRRFVLGRHPDLGRLLHDLLADRVDARVQLCDRSRSLGALSR